MRVWVNFAELRKKLNFEDVLRHYGVEVKKKGVQHQGFCPFPAEDIEAFGGAVEFEEEGVFRKATVWLFLVDADEAVGLLNFAPRLKFIQEGPGIRVPKRLAAR